jgi:hypothetical protein
MTYGIHPPHPDPRPEPPPSPTPVPEPHPLDFVLENLATQRHDALGGDHVESMRMRHHPAEPRAHALHQHTILNRFSAVPRTLVTVPEARCATSRLVAPAAAPPFGIEKVHESDPQS